MLILIFPLKHTVLSSLCVYLTYILSLYLVLSDLKPWPYVSFSFNKKMIRGIEKIGLIPPDMICLSS